MPDESHALMTLERWVSLAPEDRYRIIEAQGLTWMTSRALKVLTEDIPKELIKQREGPGGKKLSYLPHGWYREKLNEAFGWDWDWIRDEVMLLKEDDQIIFLGHLTIRIRNPLTGEVFSIITKSGEGGADIKRYASGAHAGKMISAGNDLKAASSDALVRACLNLALSLKLWYDDLDKVRDNDNGNGNGNGNDAEIVVSKVIDGQFTETKIVKVWMCNDCHTVIPGGVTAKSNKPFTADQMAELAIGRHQVPLCYNCFIARGATAARAVEVAEQRTKENGT